MPKSQIKTHKSPITNQTLAEGMIFDFRVSITEAFCLFCASDTPRNDLRMVSIDTFRKLALSFPEATEEPHFEKTSFRVRKKIFATFDGENKRASLKLSEIDQDTFSSIDRTIIYPIDNKWGKQGWTIVDLKRVRKSLFVDALTTAYCEVAPKKLAEQVRPAGDPNFQEMRR